MQAQLNSTHVISQKFGSRAVDSKGCSALRARKAASQGRVSRVTCCRFSANGFDCSRVARQSVRTSATAVPDYYDSLFAEVEELDEDAMWAEHEANSGLMSEGDELGEGEVYVEEEADDFVELPDGFEDKLLQVRRVTKVVKGGKQMSFRAVVVIGDGNGTVGVGCGSAAEVLTASQVAILDAKSKLVKVGLSNRSRTFQHRVEKRHAAARVMLRPASDGTGLIAGGAVRVVLELAGVKNAFGKQLGSDNLLNNARATVKCLEAMQSLEVVARQRKTTVAELMA